MNKSKKPRIVLFPFELRFFSALNGGGTQSVAPFDLKCSSPTIAEQKQRARKCIAANSSWHNYGLCFAHTHTHTSTGSYFIHGRIKLTTFRLVLSSQHEKDCIVAGALAMPLPPFSNGCQENSNSSCAAQQTVPNKRNCSVCVCVCHSAEIGSELSGYKSLRCIIDLAKDREKLFTIIITSLRGITIVWTARSEPFAEQQSAQTLGAHKARSWQKMHFGQHCYICVHT